MAGMVNHTTYTPAHAEKARIACKYGATDQELAQDLGVSYATVNRWKLEHEEFNKALVIGKDLADNRVERTLYNKAIGYDITEEQAIKLKDQDGSERVEIVEIKKHIPADTASALFWLRNRKRLNWNDKREISIQTSVSVEHKTLDPALLTDDQRFALREALQQAMLPPPIDGEYDEVD